MEIAPISSFLGIFAFSQRHWKDNIQGFKIGWHYFWAMTSLKGSKLRSKFSEKWQIFFCLFWPYLTQKWKIFVVFPILLPNYPICPQKTVWKPQNRNIENLTFRARRFFTFSTITRLVVGISGKFLHIWKLDEKTKTWYAFRFGLSSREVDQIYDWRSYQIERSQKVKFGTLGYPLVVENFKNFFHPKLAIIKVPKVTKGGRAIVNLKRARKKNLRGGVNLPPPWTR